MLTGAYALDALDELERRRFEAHLAECADCEREVAELRATAARLGAAISETPPPALRGRVIERVAQVRQEPPGRGSAVHGTRNWAMRLVSAAAVVAIAAAAVAGVLAVRADRQLDSAQARLEQEQTQLAALTDLLSAPDVRTLSGTDAGIPGDARMIMSLTRDRAMLTMTGLPDQSADSTYQAWTIDETGPHSAGVMGNAGTTEAPLVFAGVQGVRTVAVTVEPAGGSAAPTTTPVVVFTMPV